MAEQRLNAIADRLEKAVARLESSNTRGGGGGGGGNENTEIVEAFESQILNGKIKKYFELSDKLGEEIAEHAKIVKSCFQAKKEFLVLVSRHRTPKPDVLQSLLKPVSSKVDEVITFCEKRRGSKVFNHLMTVKEAIGCVGWITVSPKPAPYVKECHDQGLFYGNRVIKEFKGKDDEHVEWVRAYMGAVLELQEYVKTYHVTGLQWNPDGTEASPGAATGGGGAPAPPPPPPPMDLSDKPEPAPPKGGRPDTSALFASINKGDKITAGLKKVTNDMKTHKNPELRTSSVVKSSDVKPKTTSAPKFGGAVATKKPPKCALEGNKWVVEYQEENPSLEITPKNPKETIYIYKCTKTTVKVNGKLNSIIIDSCKRVGLVFDQTISCVEAVNSQSIQIQVLDKCPTISIDKTDGCQVYLSKNSLNCEIVSAKSSEMNILVPTGQDGDFNEFALPEQYKSVWDGKKFVTECTDINS